MGSPLPEISGAAFTARLVQAVGVALPERLLAALYVHYQELARWNPRLSLVGPGTAETVIERHYGESLAALPLLSDRPGRLADLGSGAGFPGWILAAARTDWRVTLVEPHGRKATFLRTAAHRAGIDLDVLDARVRADLPDSFPTQLDRITVRALRLEPETLASLATRLGPDGELLFWAGRDDPRAPEGWQRTEVRALGGEARRLLAYRPAPALRQAGNR